MNKCRKNKNLFGNVLVLSPNNEPMFRANEKQVHWYLSRNLAKLIDDRDILILKLLFQPKDLGYNDEPILLERLENRCVKCGIEENLQHCYVVPFQYRKLFPSRFKDHRFFDLATLCVECSKIFNNLVKEKIIQLSKEFEAPINQIDNSNKELLKMSSLAYVLLHKSSQIPTQAAIEKKDKIAKFLNKSQVDDQDLLKLIKAKDLIVKEKLPLHAEIVVSKLDNEIKIIEFINMWKDFFVENMQPKFAPAYLSLRD